MDFLLSKCSLLICLLCSCHTMGFAAEINPKQIKTNKIKHHYVEKVANTILNKELGLKISASNSCTPDTTKTIWVCYIFDHEKQTDKKIREYDRLKNRLWSVEIDFIKGKYHIYMGVNK